MLITFDFLVSVGYGCVSNSDIVNKYNCVFHSISVDSPSLSEVSTGPKSATRSETKTQSSDLSNDMIMDALSINNNVSLLND